MRAPGIWQHWPQGTSGQGAMPLSLDPAAATGTNLTRQRWAGAPTIAATRAAIASDAVNPGDSIPNRLMRPERP